MRAAIPRHSRRRSCTAVVCFFRDDDLNILLRRSNRAAQLQCFVWHEGDHMSLISDEGGGVCCLMEAAAATLV